MSGKGAVARKRAIAADVESWVYYCLYCGDHSNPFSEDDKRHKMFAKRLHQVLGIDSILQDCYEVYGCDPSTLKMRHYSKPILRTIEQVTSHI